MDTKVNDSKENIIQEKSYGYDNDLYQYTTYEYNEQGNISEKNMWYTNQDVNEKNKIIPIFQTSPKPNRNEKINLFPGKVINSFYSCPPLVCKYCNAGPENSNFLRQIPWLYRYYGIFEGCIKSLS